ncbi:MAG: diacylglycerol kinase family lipid kinase [Chloroflexi bacterium]|nr:diacylglycerol kinase family lipid kinase [Chloroflexota bacterium]
MSKVDRTPPKALIILNPVAGSVNVKNLKRIIEEQFHSAGWTLRLYLTEANIDLSNQVRTLMQTGYDLVVAVGGDGTIAEVAAGMVNSSIPLGIIPTGTWNAIARSLMIPSNPVRAISVLVGKHDERNLDLMSIGESLHVMNVGVGLSALMIKTTSREEKRKFGTMAYYSRLIKQVIGLQTMGFRIVADGKKYRGRASEIMVANYGVVGFNAIESLLDIHPDDGKADVLIFKARTILDLPISLWQAFIQRRKRTPKFRRLQASQSITIETRPEVEVQADGELIGKTPITINVVAHGVRVIVPHG